MYYHIVIYENMTFSGTKYFVFQMKCNQRRYSVQNLFHVYAHFPCGENPPGYVTNNAHTHTHTQKKKLSSIPFHCKKKWKQIVHFDVRSLQIMCFMWQYILFCLKLHKTFWDDTPIVWDNSPSLNRGRAVWGRVVYTTSTFFVLLCCAVHSPTKLHCALGFVNDSSKQSYAHSNILLISVTN